MRNVKDFKKFNDYKNEIASTVLEEVKTKVKAAVDIDEVRSAKTKSKIAIGLFMLGTLFVIISIVLILKKVEVGAIGYISLLVITFIIFIIAIVIFAMVKKTKKAVREKILRSLNINELYRKAFETLDKGISYDSKQYKGDMINYNELQLFKSHVPLGADLHTASSEVQWKIDDTYDVALINAIWKYETRDRKGNKETTFHNSSLIKIDTRPLKEKSFKFSLFTSSNHKKIDLENKQFSKVFKVRSDDELKIRQMYTPLSMELSLERYRDNNETKVKNFEVLSTGDAIYIWFVADLNFMFIDIPTSLEERVLVKSIYEDFMIDTYTFYYLLSILYIPIYLQ